MTPVAATFPGEQATDPADRRAHRPVFYRPGRPEDRAAREQLLARRPWTQVIDTLDAQLAELVRCRHARPLDAAAVREGVQAELGAGTAEAYGVWVYYPWSGRLVHVLDEREFVLVRTNRNHHKITPAEHERLATKKVGIIGLSVGQSVALTMALERSCGQLRLADHDTIDLSNLNRLRVGIHALSIPKVVAAAREIAEIDPFLDVVVYPEGITPANLDAFFTAGGRLDAVIEECDNLEIKLRTRLKARELGVPVIMDTSDGGLLDVERFDLEPDRPPFHGVVGDLDPAQLVALTTHERVALSLRIVGVDRLTPRMKASIAELGQTVTTWPQLASAVAHGGGMAADVTRRILLGELHSSGRFRVDLEELIRDPEPPPAPTPTPTPDLRAGLAPPRPDVRGPDAEVVAAIVAAAVRAPSLGNDQPWRWRWSQGRLSLLHDPARSTSFGDVEQMSAWVSLGAALENAVLRAQALGFAVRLVEAPGAAAALELLAQAGPDVEPRRDEALAAAIERRFTSRSRRPAPPVADAALARLRRQCGAMTLHMRDAPGDLRAFAELSGRADRLRLLHPEMHRDFFTRELQPEDAPARDDGIPLGNLGLGASERVLLRLLGDPAAAALLRRWRLGGVLERVGAGYVDTASHLGFLVVPSYEPRALLAAGRVFQRIWLAATHEGIGLMPIAAPTLLVARLVRLAGAGFTAAERAEAAALQADLERMFPVSLQHQTGVLFRLAAAEPPAVPAPRRPVHAVLAVD